MNSLPESIVIAARNPGKLVEVVSILEGLPFKPLSLSDFTNVIAVEESGQTFAANAILKAQGYARQTEHCSIADDSGVEVDALGGVPRVISARFAGEGVDADHVSLLLSCMESIPEEKRTGRFRCVIAMADAKGDLTYLANGACVRRIDFHPRGCHGFGYDPVFTPHGSNLTCAEMEFSVKNQLSHRAMALSKMRHFLVDFIEQR